MPPPRYKRPALLACLLLLLVLLVPVLLTWRAWRQVRLDHALIAAIKQRDAQRVLLLLDTGADANAQDVPLRQGASWSQMFALWRRRSSPSSALPTALIVAIDQRTETNGFLPETPSIVAALLRKGANVNAVNPYGDTPLLMLFRGRLMPNTRSIVIIPAENIKLEKMLLEANANTEAGHSGGETPLLLACGYGYSDSVRLLIAKRANVNARAEGANPRTPLAAAKLMNEKKIVQMLKQAGAKE